MGQDGPRTSTKSAWLCGPHHVCSTEQRQRTGKRQSYEVSVEGQNRFTLRGKTAVLGGKPDLIARKGDEAMVIDMKTGRPSPSHAVQVALYLYALPKALERYRGLTFAGQVAYPDHTVDVPYSAVNRRLCGS